MATDYDAVILDWQTNGLQRVSEKIAELQDLLTTITCSEDMKNEIRSNIDDLTDNPTAYVNKVITNYTRAKAEAIAIEEAINED